MALQRFHIQHLKRAMLYKVVLCEFWGEHHRLYEQSSSEVHTIFANE